MKNSQNTKTDSEQVEKKVRDRHCNVTAESCGLTDYNDTDRKYTNHLMTPLMCVGACVIYLYM